MGILDILLSSTQASAKVLTLCSVGALLQHKGLLERDGRKTLGEIVSMAFIPAVCFISVAEPITAHIVVEWWPLILMSLVITALGDALGRFLVSVCGCDRMAVSICACGNFGTIPMLLLPSLCAEGNTLHGEPGCDTAIAYVAVFCIIPQVYVWTMGQSAVQNYESPAADPAEPAEDRSHYPELRGPGGMKRSKSDVELALNLTPHGQPPASATASGIGGTGWTANPAHEDGGRTTTWRRSANSVLPSPDSEVFEIDSPSLLDHEPMSYTSTATSTTTTGPPTAMLSPHRRPRKPDGIQTLRGHGGSEDLPLGAARKCSAGPPLGAVRVVASRGGAGPGGDLEAGTTLDSSSYCIAPEEMLVQARVRCGCVRMVPAVRCRTCRPRARACLKVALAPPNAALLAALLVGTLAPLKALFFSAPYVGGSSSSAPLMFLTQTLRTLMGGAFPGLMLVLGAALMSTAREFSTLEAGRRKTLLRSALAITLARLLLLPLLSGGAVAALEWAMRAYLGHGLERVMKFILLIEGATPTAMILMTISAMHQKGEQVITTALLLQYVLSTLSLTLFVAGALAVV